MRPFILMMLCVGAVMAVGCGDDDGSTPPRDGSMPDPRSCGSVAAMTVGRCVLGAGGDCRGAAEEVAGTYNMTALSGGDGMTMVIGPQGSTMLVFMVQATGIDAGDAATESTQPLVQVTLYDGATQIAMLRQRTPFTGSGPYVSGQLWVVVDAVSSSLAGHTITAVATLTDRTGGERCGIVNVVPHT